MRVYLSVSKQANYWLVSKVRDILLANSVKILEWVNGDRTERLEKNEHILMIPPADQPNGTHDFTVGRGQDTEIEQFPGEIGQVYIVNLTSNDQIHAHKCYNKQLLNRDWISSYARIDAGHGIEFDIFLENMLGTDPCRINNQKGETKSKINFKLIASRKYV